MPKWSQPAPAPEGVGVAGQSWASAYKASAEALCVDGAAVPQCPASLGSRSGPAADSRRPETYLGPYRAQGSKAWRGLEEHGERPGVGRVAFSQHTRQQDTNSRAGDCLRARGSGSRGTTASACSPPSEPRKDRRAVKATARREWCVRCCVRCWRDEPALAQSLRSFRELGPMGDLAKPEP